MNERTKIIVNGIAKPLLWRITAFFLLALMAWAFISFIFLPGHYKPEHPTNQITGIEILHIPDNVDLNRIDEGDVILCRQLDASEYEAFIQSLKKLSYQATTKQPIFHPGPAVMIYYAEGTSELLSVHCRYYYISPTSQNHYSYSFDPEAFTELLTAYGYESKS